MKKHLKLCLLLVILIIPIFLSKAQISTHAHISSNYTFSFQPETQDDANTGGDAGDDFDTATIIGIGSFTGSLPENDTDDFYRVYINMDRHAEITLTGDSGTDFDLFLYTPDRNEIMNSQNTSSNESIEIDILTFGYWFIRVNKYNLTGHGNYSMVLQTSDITSTNPTLLQNDAGTGADAGNTFSSATEITRGNYFGMLVDFDYYDYYKIALVPGDVIVISLSFQESSNFDLFFYDPAVNRLASSTMGITSEGITLVVNAVGLFRILVSRLTGFGSYELSILVSHPRELDFNWKALVAIGAVLVVIIGIFLIVRFSRLRAFQKRQREIDGVILKPLEQERVSSKEHDIISYDDALAESVEDLSIEEKDALDKLLRGYSTEKDKK